MLSGTNGARTNGARAKGTVKGAGHAGATRFRTGLALACLVYAGVALGTGLDRQTAHESDPAAQVPGLFSSKALEARTWQAMDDGDWAGAARVAAALVSREPIDPLSTALLGTARDRLGDARGADTAFRVARQMGWRVELTQRYWLGPALDQGDYTTASAYVDALLRQQPNLISDRSILDPLERSEQGQQALAMRLAAKPDWLPTYMDAVWDVPRDILLLRANVLLRAARLGVVGGCAPASQIASRLVSLGEAEVAAQVWRAHCPQTGAGLVTDANFVAATFSDTATPFDWEFLSSADIDTAFVPAPGGGKWLTINTSAPYTRMVASQFIVVPAGAYRLSWASQGHTTADTPMVIASMDCRMHSDNWLPATQDPRSQRWFADVTLGDTCAGKWLNFAVRPGVKAGAGVGGGDVSLGAVRLEPLVTQ